jgi:hypothetical protein
MPKGTVVIALRIGASWSTKVEQMKRQHKICEAFCSVFLAVHLLWILSSVTDRDTARFLCDVVLSVRFGDKLTDRQTRPENADSRLLQYLLPVR